MYVFGWGASDFIESNVCMFLCHMVIWLLYIDPQSIVYDTNPVRVIKHTYIVLIQNSIYLFINWRTQLESLLVHHNNPHVHCAVLPITFWHFKLFQILVFNSELYHPLCTTSIFGAFTYIRFQFYRIIITDCFSKCFAKSLVSKWEYIL